NGHPFHDKTENIRNTTTPPFPLVAPTPGAKHMKVYPGPRATILAYRILTVLLAALGCLSLTRPAYAQCPDPSPTRPILFVHGFTGSSTDWGNSSDSGLRGSVISQLTYTSGYSNSTDYDLYFDGAHVRVSKGNA